MNGINKAILVGTLGKDPETRYMPSGKCIASFSMATSENWKDKQTGEKQERTEWHNITAFDKLGEICSEYLKKGSQVYIEGKITTEKWQDKSGNDRYTTKIIAQNMQMLGGRPQSQGSNQQAQPANENVDANGEGFVLDDNEPLPF